MGARRAVRYGFAWLLVTAARAFENLKQSLKTVDWAIVLLLLLDRLGL